MRFGKFHDHRCALNIVNVAILSGYSNNLKVISELVGINKKSKRKGYIADKCWMPLKAKESGPLWKEN